APLLRRAGFGPLPAEVAQAIQAGPDGAVDAIFAFPPAPESVVEYGEIRPAEARVEDMVGELRRTGTRPKDSPELRAAYQEVNRAHARAVVALTGWWLDRMARTPAPLQEKAHAVLARALHHVVRRRPGRRRHRHPEPALPPARRRELHAPARRPGAGSGDAPLPEQRCQPQGAPQRELGPRTDGALYPGDRALHVDRHPGVRAGLDGVDARGRPHFRAPAC